MERWKNNKHNYPRQRSRQLRYDKSQKKKQILAQFIQIPNPLTKVISNGINCTQTKKFKTFMLVKQKHPQKTTRCSSINLKQQQPQFTNQANQNQSENINQDRLINLKTQITPVEKIWQKYVKKYLNDSQLVQIYRQNKSLEQGKSDYGKTIIKYRAKQYGTLAQYKKFNTNVFSRAYFKLWEILFLGILQPVENQKINIACIAEGPGGFIQALVDFRTRSNQKDDYFAITLKINSKTRNAKDWSDFRAKSYFNHLKEKQNYKIILSYGQTGTGDLLRVENIQYFQKTDLNGKKCYLVTGDGGIQCIGDKEFNYQQVFNVKLFFSQIITAFSIQKTDGVFILKIYDSQFELTNQLILLLCFYYKRVRIVKPVTSRPGNSQRYIVSQGFIGIQQSEIQHLKQILKFWVSHQQKVDYFGNKMFVHMILKFPLLEKQKELATELLINLDQINRLCINDQIKKLKEGLDIANQLFNSKQQNLSEQISIPEKWKVKMQQRFKFQINYAYSWCKKYKIATVAKQK